MVTMEHFMSSVGQKNVAKLFAQSRVAVQVDLEVDHGVRCTHCI